MKKLKVLLSAYACEPGKGSEPEIGWQWALQMARFHNVTVLTRANNRGSIEAALPTASPGEGSIRFIYHDLPSFALWLKKRLPLSIWYYLAWQKSAEKVICALLQREHFDLLHHVTYGSVRYPMAISGHCGPVLWGPIGGIEDLPWRMLSARYPGPFISEILRNLSNGFQSSMFSGLKQRAGKCAGVIASTKETQSCFHDLGVDTFLLPAIGIHKNERPAPPLPRKTTGPLKLLFVGRLLFWKGIDLALHALAQSGTSATLTLIGNGPFKKSAQALAKKLGIESQVEFRGQQSREAVLSAYQEFDAMLHPSLHDSGAFVLLEAMIHGLPAICLDRGGPGWSVKPGCGWKISPFTRAQTIHDLAEAIRAADHDRDRLRSMGNAARESVIAHYDWDAQGDAMNIIYQRTVETFTSSRRS